MLHRVHAINPHAQAVYIDVSTATHRKNTPWRPLCVFIACQELIKFQHAEINRHPTHPKIDGQAFSLTSLTTCPINWLWRTLSNTCVDGSLSVFCAAISLCALHFLTSAAFVKGLEALGYSERATMPITGMWLDVQFVLLGFAGVSAFVFGCVRVFLCRQHCDHTPDWPS